MSGKQRNHTDTDSSFPEFDVLMELALNDPEAFEAERKEIIDSFLDTVPEENKRRLVGLQWQIDQVRTLAKSPMASCVAISNMMKDSLDKLSFYQQELLRLNPLEPGYSSEPLQEPEPAKILPFSRSNTRH